jgi:hypothetical protein
MYSTLNSQPGAAPAGGARATSVTFADSSRFDVPVVAMEGLNRTSPTVRPTDAAPEFAVAVMEWGINEF